MPVEREDHLDAAYTAIVHATGEGLKQAAEDERDAIIEGFQTGQDVLGRPWTPLAESTIKQTGPQILVDWGTMRDSTFARRTGPLSASVGVADPKIHRHEHGGENLPRRQVIEPARIDLKENRLQGTVARAIGRALVSFRAMSMFG